MQEKHTEYSSAAREPDRNAESPFRIAIRSTGPLKQRLLGPPLKLFERLLFLDYLDGIYRRIRSSKAPGHFLSKFLDEMKVSYEISDDDRARIPAEGPVIVVANHPYGGMESAVLLCLLRSVRPDSKVLANLLLKRIPEVRDYCIFVDPFHGKTSKRVNLAPLRETVQWIRAGKMLLIFPAGEVSHLSWNTPGVVDPKWDPTIARIVKMTQCPVLPLFVEGHNGPFFQMAGLIHPRLRTAMLPQEMIKMRNTRIRLSVGAMIPYEKLSTFSSDTALMDYLRFRTYLLEHRNRRSGSRIRQLFRHPHGPAKQEPVAPPEEPALMAAEVEHLPEEQKLVESNRLAVYYARAPQIRHLLFEIGRLREIAFRLEQEGTGKSVDLDRFDENYVHLFVWDKESREVVGAYRLACTDSILSRFGKRGLYTSTLFRYRGKVLRQINPALELGRSFVRPERQRDYSALHLLWRGIGLFVVRYPRYRNLFGPVSVSNKYSSVSHWLLTEYLKHNSFDRGLACHVRPRCRPRSKPAREYVQTLFDTAVTDIETISGVISDVEGGQKGVPILLKQYLRLGGKILGFNRDPQFGDVIDGLILVDLVHTDRKHLQHFMGKEGVESFLAYHAGRDRADDQHLPPHPLIQKLTRRGRQNARTGNSAPH